MKAVILAGGKGTRLKPYTTVFPKPLMPLGDKPILEIVIRQLKSHGFDGVIITVGHLAELIMTFFGDGSKFETKIKYSREDKPLGTAGGLGLIKQELNETFLMMNGDVLTTLDYSDLVNYQKRNGAIATIALNKREVDIDFGVVELDNDNSIVGYKEKPKIEYLVSMISNGETVKGYVYDGYWLDIGRPDDYERANREIEEIYDKLLRQ
jgi:NDP-sugar pyrophosphorylase family protein